MTPAGQPQFAPRTLWTRQQLEADRLEAEDQFRRQRMEEPLEEYLDHFDAMQSVVEDFIESTVDLSQLEQQALSILSDEQFLDAFRYLAGPPISIDDLKTLVETRSLSPSTLQNDPDLVHRLVETIRTVLDRRRFPWISEGREPSQSEREAAVVATAALIATLKAETGRRTVSKQDQEARVRQALLDHGFRQVPIPHRHITTMSHSPRPGEFCGEVKLGDRKADMVVGLWDGRIMPIECKVSNSSTNSVKRLNNDAMVKAKAWLEAFGERHVVPAATLSGVYKLHNLEQAQDGKLVIYWAHRLSDLTDWISSTKG